MSAESEQEFADSQEDKNEAKATRFEGISGSAEESEEEGSFASDSDYDEAPNDSKHKADLHDWFFVRMDLAQNLDDELWADFTDEKRIDRCTKQLKCCHEKGSKWVVHETPAWDLEFQMVNDISRFGKDSHVDLVKSMRLGIQFAMRTIFKNKVRESNRSKLFKKIREEIGLLLVAADYETMVTTYKVFEDEAAVYVIQSYCPRGNLEDHILSVDAPVGELEIHHVFTGICSAVFPYHDIGGKFNSLALERILLLGKKGVHQHVAPVVLPDFGIIRGCVKNGKAYSKTFQDYFYYSPEEYHGGACADSDVWSLGVMLFMMKFKFPPFMSVEKKMKPYRSEMQKLSEQGFDPTVKDGNGPWFPRAPCSDELKDLIKRMLTKNIRERIKLSEVFEHPWMVMYAERFELITYLAKDLHDFIRLPVYIRELLVAIVKAGKIMPKEEIAMYKKVYMKLDADGDGTLDIAEVMGPVVDHYAWEFENEEVKVNFENKCVKCFGDGKGAFSLDKMIYTKVLAHSRSHTQQLEDLLNFLDDDKNKKISKQEYLDGIKKLLEGTDALSGEEFNEEHLEKYAQDFVNHSDGSIKEIVRQTFQNTDELDEG